MAVSSVRTPGIGSAVGRVLLIAFAVLQLVGLPETVAVWDDPVSPVIPREQNMPKWGNCFVFVALAVGVVLLVWGWLARRRRMRPHTVLQSLRLFVIAVLAAYSVVLIVSQVIFMTPEYTPEGDEIVNRTGFLAYYADGMAALFALAMVAILARDTVALSRIGARARRIRLP